jgi:hypothetical protein
MMILRVQFIAVLIFTTFCSSHIALADYALRWSPTSGSSTGAPITVDLFLDETSPDMNLANFGAAGATYDVKLTGVGSLSVPVGNPSFDLVSPTGSGSYVTLAQTSILGLPAAGSLLVGSFTINPTMIGNGSLSIMTNGTLADFGVYDSMFNTQVLDGMVYNNPPTFNFTFVPVPEPSSAMLMLASLFGLARIRRLRPA